MTAGVTPTRRGAQGLGPLLAASSADGLEEVSPWKPPARGGTHTKKLVKSHEEDGALHQQLRAREAGLVAVLDEEDPDRLQQA
jgi:hypothetical protein